MVFWVESPRCYSRSFDHCKALLLGVSRPTNRKTAGFAPVSQTKHTDVPDADVFFQRGVIHILCMFVFRSSGTLFGNDSIEGASKVNPIITVRPVRQNVTVFSITRRQSMNDLIAIVSKVFMGTSFNNEYS